MAVKKDWEKELEEDASKEAARTKAGGGGLGNQLSIKKRRFTFGGDDLGRTLNCVVVDFVHLNTFYRTKFKEDAVSIPSCFALSEDGDEMEPHENSSKKESDACEGCPKNEWGSAARGRGKACGNRRRLGVIHIDDAGDAESLAEATIAVLSVPPTSVGAWDKYVKELKAKASRPYWAVVTKLGFDMDADFPTLTFELEEKISEKELVDAVKERREEIRELLMTPFEESDDDDEEDRPRKRKVRDDDDEEEEDEKPRKRRKPVDDDDDDDTDSDDDDDKDDEDDEEDGKKGRTSRAKKKVRDEDEDDEDDEEKKPRRKSRFGK